jgi:hypothetical protein
MIRDRQKWLRWPNAQSLKLEVRGRAYEPSQRTRPVLRKFRIAKCCQVPKGLLSCGDAALCDDRCPSRCFGSTKQQGLLIFWTFHELRPS